MSNYVDKVQVGGSDYNIKVPNGVTFRNPTSITPETNPVIRKNDLAQSLSSSQTVPPSSNAVKTVTDALSSELTNNAVLSASGYKATGITSAYGSIVKTGKRVSINIGWSGSVSSNGAILNLPDGYKPAATASGAHMIYTTDWLAGNCTIETDGKLWDSTTSGTKTKGVISIDYYIA